MAGAADDDFIINPENGVYVEMEGIMEVRYYYNDYDENDYDKEDLFDFQDSNRYISEDFCHKDKDSGAQNIFYCLVCECEVKSVVPLKGHVVGKKHAKRALDRKRKVLGIELEPQNAPKKKKPNPPRQRIDINITLEERMREAYDTFLGLHDITEFKNPRKSTDPPLYTCRQIGCKSAWGNSDDMFNHLKQIKHMRNFLKIFYNEDTDGIEKLNKNEVLRKAEEYATEHDCADPDTRDYQAIRKVADYEQYKEIQERSIHWTESKDKSKRDNTNFEPLGSRSTQTNERVPLFSSDWDRTPRPSLAVRVESLISNFRRSIESTRKKIDCFEGSIGDNEYNDILEIIDEDLFLLRDLIELHKIPNGPDEEHIYASAQKLLTEVSELEVRLRENGDPEKRKSLDVNNIRTKFTDLFTAEVSRIVQIELRPVLSDQTEQTVQTLANKITREKIIPNETKTFLKKGLSWNQFLVNEKTKSRVRSFVALYVKNKLKK